MYGVRGQSKATLSCSWTILEFISLIIFSLGTLQIDSHSTDFIPSVISVQ